MTSIIFTPFIIIIFIIVCIAVIFIIHYGPILKIILFDGMTKIDDHIYIGSIYDANNINNLKSNNIECVLSILSSHNTIIKYPNIEYMRISIEDVPSSDISKYFKDTFTFIDNSIVNKKNILIHCKSGISRSATILCAYLMKKYKINYDDALKIIKNKRKIINPNDGFIEQLKNFEMGT